MPIEFNLLFSLVISWTAFGLGLALVMHVNKGSDNGGDMIRGTITARHIILHPVTLIGAFGILRYLRMLVNCMSSSPHCFTDFIRR